MRIGEVICDFVRDEYVRNGGTPVLLNDIVANVQPKSSRVNVEEAVRKLVEGGSLVVEGNGYAPGILF